MVETPKKIDGSQLQNTKDFKPVSASNKFSAYLGPAMAPLARESAAYAGYPNTSNVLYSAMTAFPSAVQAFGGSGASVAYPGAYGSTPGVMGVGSYGGSVESLMGIGTAKYTTGYGSDAYTGGVGGTGVDQMQLINTLNDNNLQLLELQAVMQSNMQMWTTRSNILSADHRARMSIVEKFNARG